MSASSRPGQRATGGASRNLIYLRDRLGNQARPVRPANQDGRGGKFPLSDERSESLLCHQRLSIILADRTTDEGKPGSAGKTSIRIRTLFRLEADMVSGCRSL